MHHEGNRRYAGAASHKSGRHGERCEGSGKQIASVVRQVMASVALSVEARDRVIQMVWEDRTPFEAIEAQFGLKESEV
ncbi:MAG: DUF2805 domain-containing protein, partial [Burkholderiales bacterium]